MQPHPYLREVQLRRDESVDPTRYPFHLPAVRHLDRLAFHRDVTFLLGENGSGKSTLLEAIAIAYGFNPEGGTRNFNFHTWRSHSDLHRSLRCVKSYKKADDGFFLRAESFFNVASEVDRMEQELGGLLRSYGGVSLHEQSHGESFLSLVLHRFRGRGLYILDEPEAALSPSRQLALLRRMHELVQQESQFIIATHSPILMAYPGARLYWLSADGVREVSYQETEHYQVTRRFLSDPIKAVEALMNDLVEEEPSE